MGQPAALISPVLYLHLLQILGLSPLLSCSTFHPSLSQGKKHLLHYTSITFSLKPIRILTVLPSIHCTHLVSLQSDTTTGQFKGNLNLTHSMAGDKPKTVSWGHVEKNKLQGHICTMVRCK